MSARAAGDAVEIGIDDLRRFGRAAYEQVGVAPSDAEIVVELQLDADMRGVDTHGFQRLPWYIGYLKQGRYNAAPRFEVVRESPVSVLLDGDSAIGQLACVRLMELTLEKARASGLAVGASRRSNDWGCGALYPLMAAREGFIAFGTTTSVPHLAPYGSRTRLFGNNPIVYAVPRRSAPPIVLDMALTPVALGKVLRAAAEKQPVPSGWGFLDREGRPTTDAEAALAGIIPAIGAYKGTGLAMAMNVLAGILPGGSHTSAVDVGRRGQLFLVISPALFGDPEDFYDAIDAMVTEVKATELLPGTNGVFLPGELEDRRLEQVRARTTVRYPPSVAAELENMAQSLGIDFPPILGR